MRGSIFVGTYLYLGTQARRHDIFSTKYGVLSLYLQQTEATRHVFLLHQSIDGKRWATRECLLSPIEFDLLGPDFPLPCCKGFDVNRQLSCS